MRKPVISYSLLPTKRNAGFALELFPRDLNAKIEKGKSAERVHRRPRKGRPFSEFEPHLLRDAAVHNVRINSKTGVVDEDAAIYFANINRRDMMLDNRAHSAREIEWNVQIFCEVIERAEWQHPKKFSLAAGQQTPRSRAQVPSFPAIQPYLHFRSLHHTSKRGQILLVPSIGDYVGVGLIPAATNRVLAIFDCKSVLPKTLCL